MVELFLPLVALATGLSVASLVASFRRNAQLAAWEQAALACGLAERRRTEGGTFGGHSLEGESEGLHVRLDSYRRGKYERGTEITITGLRHAPRGLSLRREGLASAFEKNVVGEREIELGDTVFDREHYIRGDAATAFAALGPDARRPIARLLAGSIPAPPGEPVDVSASLADGQLQVRVRENGFSSGNRERLGAILASALAIARPLVVGKDRAIQIAANVAAEPNAGVRRNAIALLAREYPGHAATAACLRAALDDPSEDVRVRAAVALGPDGVATLLRVAGSGDGDAAVARAVTALGPALPGAAAEAVVRRALAAGTERRESLLAGLEHLRAHGTTAQQAALVDALAHEDDAVAIAAARALGRVGDVAAVASLLDAGAGARRAASRQAVAEIQSRLPGAGAGQLSIAPGEAGALSLADGEAGRLSIAETAPPRPPATRGREAG